MQFVDFYGLLDDEKTAIKRKQTNKEGMKEEMMETEMEI